MLTFNDFSKGCAKGLLIVLNGLCILVALCTFGFAVVDIRIIKQYGDEQAAGTCLGDLTIIAISLLLFIIAVVGCTGAARENGKILYLYVSFLLVIIILELLVAIFVSVQRYGLEFKVTNWIRDDFYVNITTENKEIHTKLWDDLQTTYECCGLNGPEDYEAINRPISLSCCPRAYRARSEYAQQQQYRSCIDSESYYSAGCEDELLYILRSDADWLFGVAVLSFWFEGVSMLLAMWIANNLKNSVQVYKSTVRY